MHSFFNDAFSTSIAASDLSRGVSVSNLHKLTQATTCVKVYASEVANTIPFMVDVFPSFILRLDANDKGEYDIRPTENVLRKIASHVQCGGCEFNIDAQRYPHNKATIRNRLLNKTLMFCLVDTEFYENQNVTAGHVSTLVFMRENITSAWKWIYMDPNGKNNCKLETYTKLQPYQSGASCSFTLPPVKAIINISKKILADQIVQENGYYFGGVLVNALCSRIRKDGMCYMAFCVNIHELIRIYKQTRDITCGLHLMTEFAKVVGFINTTSSRIGLSTKRVLVDNLPPKKARRLARKNTI